jgi:hypothetical protein
MAMKYFFLTIAVVSILFYLPIAADDLQNGQIRFPKEIPADKGDVLAERILDIAGILRSVDYGALQKYWSGRCFDDGFFIVDYYGWKRSNTVLEKQNDKYNFTVGLYLLDKRRIKEEGFFGNTDGLMVKFLNEVPFATYYEAGKHLKCHVWTRIHPDTKRFGYLRMLYHPGLTEKEKMERKLEPDKIFPDKETEALYQWDKEGRFTFKGDADILLKKWQVPDVTDTSQTIRQVDWGHSPQIPHINGDKNLQAFIGRMKKMMSARKFDEFALLLDMPAEYLTEKNASVSESNTHANFFIDNWQCRWGTASGYINRNDKDKFREIEFAFIRNSKGMPAVYLEGDIDDPDMINATIPILSKSGRGIEVRFHPNGMPKSYYTMVRGRHYGRQIEWDDNGKVIFDIDLDIPSADIPAEVKNTAKAEVKSATETKSTAITPSQPVEAVQDSGESIGKTMHIVTLFVFVFLVVPLLCILVFLIYKRIKSRK